MNEFDPVDFPVGRAVVMVTKHFHEISGFKLRKAFTNAVFFRYRVQRFGTDGDNSNQAETFNFFAFLQTHGFFNALKHRAGFKEIPTETAGHGFGAIHEGFDGHAEAH